MQYGVAMFITDYSMSPTELARAVEERGFENLMLPEHSHVPLPRVSPWPGGGDLPKQYYDVMDPFVALGAAAAVTTELKLGTGICLVIQRDPIQLALEVATLDRISNGRFLFGVGAGWNAEEMADHGTDFKTRFQLMRERVAALKVIWTQEKAEYHGEFVDFELMATEPKPVQKPHPPIIVAGGFPQAAKRAIEYGDGWLPIDGHKLNVIEVLPRFREMATEAGRDADALGVSLFGVAGDIAEERQLARYRDAGIERVIFRLPSQGRDAILPLLDQFAAQAPATAA